ncbi:MAG: hypothetical protein ACKVPY_16930 [Paracoccaceae bacterium]
MKRRLLCALVALSIALPSCVNACSMVGPTFMERVLNKRVKQKTDCSFVNGGVFDDETGEAAIDLGNGRIAQNLIGDRVLLAECNTGKTAILLGKQTEETTCGLVHELSPYLFPKGRLKLDSGGSLDDFIEKTRADGFDIVRGPLSTTGPKRDHVDEMCGCKLFYPDSVGATQ